MLCRNSQSRKLSLFAAAISLRFPVCEVARGTMGNSASQDTVDALAISKEERERHFLRYGGSYDGDVKDTTEFRYLTYTEYPKFGPEHRSLVAKYLTPEIFEKLKGLKTSKGYTLSNLIMTGVVTPHLGVGVTAGDEESWTLFKDLLYPIVNEWHGYDPSTQTQPLDLDPLKLIFTEEQRDLFTNYVISTRIRASRNISGYAMPAGCVDKDRLAVETLLKNCFTNLTGELAGPYYSLQSLTPTQSKFLHERGFLFQAPSTRNLLTGSGASRSWPQGRGVYHNTAQTALAWVNEEDHCRIISMEMGGDIPNVFRRFCDLSDSIELAANNVETSYMRDDALGFLSTCPSNIGTGMRASVMVVLPAFNKLMQEGTPEDRELLDQVCSLFFLQPRGSNGEFSAAEGAKFDISNKLRVGLSEVMLVQKMIDGITKVIEVEQFLDGGGSPSVVREKLSAANCFKAQPLCVIS